MLPLGLILILSIADVVASVGAVQKVIFANAPSKLEVYIIAFAPPVLFAGW